MPQSDSGDSKRGSTKAANHGAPPPPEQEQLPCPRCDSTNTKFCYYNNYNHSQPRHFCKTCRRYWTRGGTLRDIPVGGGGGGGMRKSAKRPRTNNHHHPSSSSSSAAASANYEAQPLPPLSATPPTPVLFANQAPTVPFGEASGVLAMGGFGLGFEEVGFGLGLGLGLGRGIWPFVEVGGGGGGDGAAAVNGSGGNATVTGNGSTWQYDIGGESAAFIGGDCFPWPDLAISTPGIGLK